VRQLRIFAFDLSSECVHFVASHFKSSRLPTNVVVNAQVVGIDHSSGRRVVGSTSCHETNQLRESVEGPSDTVTNSRQKSVSVKLLITLLPPGTHTDFLSTDTEGHDHNVFYGSREMFVARRVSVYMFEIHHRAPPAHPRYTRLIVEDLDSLGYECHGPLEPPIVQEKGPRSLMVRVTGCGQDSLVQKFVGWRRWNGFVLSLYLPDFKRRSTLTGGNYPCDLHDMRFVEWCLQSLSD